MPHLSVNLAPMLFRGRGMRVSADSCREFPLDCLFQYHGIVVNFILRRIQKRYSPPVRKLGEGADFFPCPGRPEFPPVGGAKALPSGGVMSENLAELGAGG